jgi:CelD/BcsL family acetyltransferase involved in cellulose biosynthesis
MTSARFEIGTAMSQDELEAAWLDLEARASPPVFLSWDWIGCWIAELSPRPFILTGQADGRIVLLGALASSARRDVLPVTIHGLQLHTVGDPQRDIITVEYNGFLVDRDWVGKIESDAIAFLLSGIPIGGKRHDELHLRTVAADLAGVVSTSGFRFRELHRKPSWRVDLAELRAAGRRYLDSLSANTRQQIRRSMRLYEKRGALSVVRAASVPEALAFLDALKDLHQHYWNSRGEPGGFAFPFFERFQRRLIEVALPHGTVEIVKVAAGSDVIGYVYNLVYRGHVYAYQTGIRYEDDPRLKPGLVSHCLCIDRHYNDGSIAYDFMAGEARYKASLGIPGPEFLYLLVQRPSWPLQLENALYDVRRRLAAAARWQRARR